MKLEDRVSSSWGMLTFSVAPAVVIISERSLCSSDATIFAFGARPFRDMASSVSDMLVASLIEIVFTFLYLLVDLHDINEIDIRAIFFLMLLLF